ncbi:MAG TPA: alpha/beta hydrolase [Candidatus Binataceae bacterium]|nr:alpha/beta hydrolase [Candidatus Binataceae bacterium]
MNAQEFHSSRQFTETPCGRIAHVERGEGPVALFVHGLPLCGFQWRYQMEDLAPIRKCVAPDLMGVGYTEPNKGQDISFESQAKMLAAFLDARGIAEVDLVGNDTGGGVSQIFAATHPRRIRTLTLTNCEVSNLWPNQMLQQFYGALKSGAIGEAFKAMATNEALAQQQLGGAVFENPASLTAEMAGVYFGPFAESADRREQVRGFADALKNRDQLVAAGSRLKESKFPSQVIWGDADTAFDTPGSLEWLRGNIGGMRRVITVPGAKLFWPEEHPRVLSTLLKDFWNAN